jgi:hypothetical protein
LVFWFFGEPPQRPLAFVGVAEACPNRRLILGIKRAGAPLRLYALAAVLLVAGDDAARIQDEVLIIECGITIAAEVFPLVAVSVYERRAAAAGIVLALHSS